MNEEEAIKNLKGMLKYKRQVYNMDTMRTEIVPALYDIDRNAIKTVLNLLEKKDKEIQFQKEINKTEQNRHKQTEKSLKGQLKKKDNKIALLEQSYKELQDMLQEKDKEIEE